MDRPPVPPELKPRRKAVLVDLEGGVGVGKTTLAWSLLEVAEEAGVPTIVVHYSMLPFAAAMFAAVLGRDRGAESPWDAAVLGLGAAWVEILNLILRPAIENGVLVIVDRYFPSTVSHQATAGGDPTKIYDFFMQMVECIPPTITLVMYAERHRVKALRQARGNLDAEHADVNHLALQEVHDAVDLEIRRIFRLHPENVAMVKGDARPERVLKTVCRMLHKRGILEFMGKSPYVGAARRAHGWLKLPPDQRESSSGPWKPELSTSMPRGWDTRHHSVQVKPLGPAAPFARLDPFSSLAATTIQMAFEGLSGSVRKVLLQIVAYMLRGEGYDVRIVSPFSTQRGTEMTDEIRYPGTQRPSPLAGFMVFCGAIRLTQHQVVEDVLRANNGRTAILWDHHLMAQLVHAAADGLDVSHLKKGLNDLSPIPDLFGIHLTADPRLAKNRTGWQLIEKLRDPDVFQGADIESYQRWERTSLTLAAEQGHQIVEAEGISYYEVALKVLQIIDRKFHTSLESQLTLEHVKAAVRLRGHGLVV